MAKTRLIIDHIHEARIERAMLDEFIFWGVHTFRETWYSMACGLCGNSWTEVVHNGKTPDWDE